MFVSSDWTARNVRDDEVAVINFESGIYPCQHEQMCKRAQLVKPPKFDACAGARSIGVQGRVAHGAAHEQFAPVARAARKLCGGQAHQICEATRHWSASQITWPIFVDEARAWSREILVTARSAGGDVVNRRAALSPGGFRPKTAKKLVRHGHNTSADWERASREEGPMCAKRVTGKSTGKSPRICGAASGQPTTRAPHGVPRLPPHRTHGHGTGRAPHGTGPTRHRTTAPHHRARYVDTVTGPFAR